MSILTRGVGRCTAGFRSASLTAQDYINLQQLHARYNEAIDSGDAEGTPALSRPTVCSTPTRGATRSWDSSSSEKKR